MSESWKVLSKVSKNSVRGANKTELQCSHCAGSIRKYYFGVACLLFQAGFSNEGN